MSKKKLFLLDAFALIYRSHFAFIRAPRINSKGMNTSAVFGVTNTILDVLTSEKPSHIAVVFDAPGGSVRNVEFEAYKAHREEMPEDIRIAIPYIKQLCEALKIPTLQAEGYEADDVIGTLAKQAEKSGYQVYMMTPDKDFGQLVSENIFMYRPGKAGQPREIWGVEEVCAKFEIENPLQVIDVLGLWGDAADNIPGIPGIGEKTAKKLVAQYGSVEGLIAHADELKGKQKENVIAFADQGLLSKKLATILLDAPVNFCETDFLAEDPDREKVINLFSELEFRALTKKVLGEEATVIPSVAKPEGEQLSMFGSDGAESNGQIALFSSKMNTLEEVQHQYRLVSADEIPALVLALCNNKEVCFDTETTGLDVLEAELVGMSFSFKKGEGYYVPVEGSFKDKREIVNQFLPFFESNSILKIAHNLKYDAAILSRYGIEVAYPTYDTMIAHYLLEPDLRNNMDFLAETYLNYTPISITTLIGKKGKQQISMGDLSPSEICDYACEDADITLQLKEVIDHKFDKPELKKLLEKVEMPLNRVLMEMEMEGIRLDTDALHNFSGELEISIGALSEKIIAAAGTSFNIDSPKQLGDILFEYLKIDDKAKKTKTGQYKTDEQTLSYLQGKHPIIDDILDYRQQRKLKSTYVDALPRLINKQTGRIHTTYSQTVAATGRLSSNNPNLQNIPIRSAMGREIRRAFIPRSNEYSLLAADYSQIELRIIAALSGDIGMQEAFVSGLDIHAATAAKVFDVSIDAVDREMRSKAKMVNFGIIYGISAFGLSQRLNIKRTEAKEIIDSYFSKYGGIKDYMDGQIGFAQQHGYVETIMHRRRYLKDINSANATVRGFAERNAINAPIQGSAADIIKVAMINIQDELNRRALKTKMILQVHDELVFDLYKPETEEVIHLVKDKMENAVSLNVPLLVEYGIADNWLDAH